MKRLFLLLSIMIFAFSPLHAQIDSISTLQAGRVSIQEITDPDIIRMVGNEVESSYENRPDFFYEIDSFIVDSIVNDTIAKDSTVKNERNVDVVLVVERSKAMSSYYNSLAATINELKKYFDTNDRKLSIGLVLYDEDIEVLKPSTKIYSAQDKLKSCVNVSEIPPAHGYKKMYDALKQATSLLTKQSSGNKLIIHVGGSGNVNSGATNQNVWMNLPNQLGGKMRESDIRYGVFQAYNDGNLTNMNFVSQSALILSSCENIKEMSILGKQKIFLKEKTNRPPKQLTNIIIRWVVDKVPYKKEATAQSDTDNTISTPKKVDGDL